MLDNLEQVFRNADLMAELASIIILLDDQRYAKHNVTFLIVGVPDNVLEYFASMDDLSSVANRLYEVDKVCGLTKQQVTRLIRRGFRLIGIKTNEPQAIKIINHTFRVTLGIPQRIHEYCKQLARQIQDHSGHFKSDMLAAADEKWLKQGFRKSLTVLNANLNSRNTKVARRNQVIFAIGHSDRLHFDPRFVEEIVKREFRKTIPKSGAIPIGEILKQLSSGKAPLLSRMKNSNEYSFRDPRDIMCVRLLLLKDRDGKVRKRALAR